MGEACNVEVPRHDNTVAVDPLEIEETSSSPSA